MLPILAPPVPCQPVAQPGGVWRNGAKGLSLHQQKEEERRLFLFLRF